MVQLILILKILAQLYFTPIHLIVLYCKSGDTDIAVGHWLLYMFSTVHLDLIKGS